MEGENKKVIGAKRVLYDGIMFRSKIEVTCYKLLKEAGLDFKYEAEQILLLDSFRTDVVKYYHPLNDKSFGRYFTKTMEPELVRKITWTPDFVMETEKTIFIIECKGHPNDAYSNIRKLVLNMLNHNYSNKDVFFFEPHRVGHIKECIKIIKEYEEIR